MPLIEFDRNLKPSEEYIYKDCLQVNSLNTTDAQCDFINSAEDCADNDGLINYNALIYCFIGRNNPIGCSLVLFIWLATLLIEMGLTANQFLCPCLVVISKNLRLSQSMAGVTFLALGNGAPDIFSSIAGIRKSRAELVIGELFGSGIFVTSVVVGIILMRESFKVMERPLLRDICFYLFATFLTWYVFWKGTIEVDTALAFIIIYLIYIIIVIVGRIIYIKLKEESAIDKTKQKEDVENLTCKTEEKEINEVKGKQLNKTKTCQMDSKFLFRGFKNFLDYFLIGSVPVVDCTIPKNNWNRYLNSFHCISGPMVFLILTGNAFCVFKNVPLALIVFLVSSIVAVVVFVTSECEKPPNYHWVFSYFGFFMSVCWIYGLANEIVDLLHSIGIMFNLSDTILGLTILAWGNSLPDLISNTTMARQGYPRMGLSGCFGGALLNLLMGIGIPYAISLNKESFSLKLVYTRIITLLYSTITFSLISTLLIMFASRFYSNKYHGYYLLGLYSIYLILANLIEFNVI